MRNKERNVDILVVDDDVATVEGLMSELDLRGVTIDCAGSIEEALASLKRTRYRLLLLDLRFEERGRLREGAGLELMAKLIEGDVGSLNREAKYVIISAQEFSLEAVEARLQSEGIAVDELRSRRRARLAKGEHIGQQADRIEDLLTLEKNN